MVKHMSVLRMAQAIVLSAVFVTPAMAQSSKQISDAKACTQRVADAKAAREEGPDISERAGKAFDEIVALATQRCTEKSYKNAGELLHIAKSMVASE